jgi:MoxR-like ATPase
MTDSDMGISRLRDKRFPPGKTGIDSIPRSEEMHDENSLTKFTGASKYVLDEELAKIVNISMALEMPLLLKGEPGTGKTMLAYAIAEALDMPLIVLNVKSSMKLVDALYQYDTLTRLNDSRFGDSKRDVSNIEDYIRMGKIGQSFVSDIRVVLLIDEIDKADTDFQDDMLDVLDQMSFDIMEIDKTVKAKNRPVIIITSNAKKDLSDPFLGRCNFHHIAFPDADMMRTIVSVHFPDISKDLMENAVRTFYRLRDIRGVEKKPATRELINWIRALKSDPDFKIKELTKGDVPYLGVLFKKSPDFGVAQTAVSRFRL